MLDRHMPTLDPIEAMEKGEDLRVDQKGNISVDDGSESVEKGSKMKPTRWA